jgi:hypothetical protein
MFAPALEIELTENRHRHASNFNKSCNISIKKCWMQKEAADAKFMARNTSNQSNATRETIIALSKLLSIMHVSMTKCGSRVCSCNWTAAIDVTLILSRMHAGGFFFLCSDMFVLEFHSWKWLTIVADHSWHTRVALYEARTRIPREREWEIWKIEWGGAK